MREEEAKRRIIADFLKLPPEERTLDNAADCARKGTGKYNTRINYLLIYQRAKSWLKPYVTFNATPMR
jgi:hypothetical protein